MAKIEKAKPLKTKPVYYHDCPALGKDTVVPEAFWGNSEVIKGRQHICLFCNYKATPFEPNNGQWKWEKKR